MIKEEDEKDESSLQQSAEKSFEADVSEKPWWFNLYEDRQVVEDEEAKAYYAHVNRDKNKSVHLSSDENFEL